MSHWKSREASRASELQGRALTSGHQAPEVSSISLLRGALGGAERLHVPRGKGLLWRVPRPEHRGPEAGPPPGAPPAPVPWPLGQPCPSLSAGGRAGHLEGPLTPPALVQKEEEAPHRAAAVTGWASEEPPGQRASSPAWPVLLEALQQRCAHGKPTSRLLGGRAPSLLWRQKVVPGSVTRKRHRVPEARAACGPG